MHWTHSALAACLLAASLPPALAQSGHDNAYTITTIAGTPGRFGNADGAGSAARFYYPNGIAVDASGNLYVADTFASRVRKITPEGVVKTIAGVAGRPGYTDGPGNDARFFDPGPYSVAVDASGNVYAADTFNSTIRKISPEGIVTTLAGMPGMTGTGDGMGKEARFKNPYGLAVDAAGNIYVADTGNSLIRRVTPDGNVRTVAGVAKTIGDKDGPRTTALFDSPKGVAVDAAGVIYVADTDNASVRKIGRDGMVTTLYRTPADAYEPGPYGLAVDAAGNVYVPDTKKHTIRRIAPDGSVTVLAGMAGDTGSTDGPGSMARFNAPYGLAVDAAGTLYVADTFNCTIRKAVPARASSVARQP